MRPAEGEVEVQQIAGWKASEWQSLCEACFEGPLEQKKFILLQR